MIYKILQFRVEYGPYSFHNIAKIVKNLQLFYTLMFFMNMRHLKAANFAEMKRIAIFEVLN